MSKELVLKWSIPDTTDESLEKEIVNLTKEGVVLRLFKEGKISSGYGAELLGLALSDFMEFLKRKKTPFTFYSKEDWEQDKKAVEKMMKAKGKGKGNLDIPHFFP